MVCSPEAIKSSTRFSLCASHGDAAALMALMSFNASEFYAFPLRFTLDWYARLAGNADIIAAAWRSLWIAIATTAIATVLGTAAALALFAAARLKKEFGITASAVYTFESPRAGTVTQILIEDGQPVEFGEPLVVIE